MSTYKEWGVKYLPSLEHSGTKVEYYNINQKNMTRTEIKRMYRDWRRENGNRKPNRVIVKMHWEDDENTDKGYQVDTIAMVPLGKIECTEDIPGDALILFYISTLKGLWELTKPNNGSDFIVDEVLEFYKL